MKRYLRYLSLITVFALVLAACGGDGEGGDTTTTAGEEPTTTAAEEPTTTAGEEATTTTGAEEPAGEAILACQVSDTGGIDDKSFNQTAWQGVLNAVEAGIATEDSQFLESQAPTDYAPNIQSFVDQGCDLIIAAGFLISGDMNAAAEANPDQLFQIIDAPSELDNLQGAVFGTADAAFLAGYLAAGVTQTGVVATYGGIQIPCGVTCFMDGFVYGVRYYNQENGTDVQTLGWNPEEQTGAFTGDFENADNGRNLTQSFVDEGADVVLPVAGPVGVGSLALAQELGNVWVVGVDADWFQTLPEYSDVILTSVLKGLDVAAFSAIESVGQGAFEGGTRLYTIQEDGVGLGPINESVDAALSGSIEGIQAGLVDGSIVACDLAEGPSDSCPG